VPGALAHLECRVTASYEAGDHVIYVGEVVRIHVNPGRPLVYQAGAYRRLGAETQEP
jgi:flavin reductase (DIM6/NTAB) family NADH-FMN oxidoreductase RutF